MPADQQLIPKVIHRVWLGPNPVPEMFERYGESWRRHHADWEMKLWTDETLPPLACQDAYDRARDFKSRYDIVRLELVRQLGGVVIDMDMECLRPLEPLLQGVRAFVPRATRRQRIGVQIIGAVPNHPLFEYAVQRLEDTAGVAPTASQESGPGFLTRIVAERPEGVTIFARDMFLSPVTIEPPRRPDDFPEMYAVHHHTESYRDPSPETEIARLTKRLTDAQLEIHRLLRREEKAEARLLKAEQKRARLEKANRRLEQELIRVRRNGWWLVGRRIRRAPDPGR